jgi:dTDP-L-rhamnose 4-epimerase
LAVFSNLDRVGQTIRVFEDGAESRDFVHIEDVVQATTACLTAGSADATH